MTAAFGSPYMAFISAFILKCWTEFIITIRLIPLAVYAHLGVFFTVFFIRNPDMTVSKVGQQRAKVVGRPGRILCQDDIVGLDVFVDAEMGG